MLEGKLSKNPSSIQVVVDEQEDGTDLYKMKVC